MAYTVTFLPGGEAIRVSGGTVMEAQIAAELRPDATCRFPEKKISSMETFGMLVLEVCKVNGLQYYYGSEKMAYSGCFLLP